MKRVKPVGIGIWFGLVWSGLGVPLRPFESWPRTIRLKSVSGRVGWLVGQSVSRSVSRSVVCPEMPHDVYEVLQVSFAKQLLCWFF